MKAIKKSKPKTYGEIRDEVARESARCDEPEDILDKKWTQKKSYSTQQMMKIMDAVRKEYFHFIYLFFKFKIRTLVP